MSQKSQIKYKKISKQLDQQNLNLLYVRGRILQVKKLQLTSELFCYKIRETKNSFLSMKYSFFIPLFLSKLHITDKLNYRVAQLLSQVRAMKGYFITLKCCNFSSLLTECRQVRQIEDTALEKTVILELISAVI